MRPFAQQLGFETPAGLIPRQVVLAIWLCNAVLPKLLAGAKWQRCKLVAASPLSSDDVARAKWSGRAR